MSNLFNSYIMVDWSAAAKPTTGADSIWIGALTPDARFKLQYTGINPETRAKALAQLTAALERLLKRGDRVLLGFDFPLGYPQGSAKTFKLTQADKAPWIAMHDFLAKELKDKADNANNRFALAARMNRIASEGPFPFWGCPKKDVLTTLSDKKPADSEYADLSEFRLSETEAARQKKGRPQPVWKLGYAGAVGGQTFTGIPIIRKLQDHFEEKIAIWPMETGWGTVETDWPPIVVSEVYPSMLDVAHVRGRVKDDVQVESLGRWFAETDSKGRLSRYLGRPDGLSDAGSEAILTEEGWILGI